MLEISEEILRQAAEGNVSAFEVVYKALASFVYNVAFRIVNNREDAKEVAQEVFLIIYHKLKDFRRESSLKTWAYRITANCAINYARKNLGQRNKMCEYDEQLIGGSVESTAHSTIEQEERTKTVASLLNILDPDQRACVVLREIEGLSYAEIATTLKININTVRSRLKRAREKLLAQGKKVAYEQV